MNYQPMGLASTGVGASAPLWLAHASHALTWTVLIFALLALITLIPRKERA